MKDSVLIEVSEILNVFNIEEITKMISTQINTNYSDDNSTDIMSDHLKPLYYTYAMLGKNKNIAEDIQTEAKIRFYAICRVFVDAICNKFKISIDNEWLDDGINNLPAFTFALYSFFVIDFRSNLHEVLLNYILKNPEEICTTFEGVRNKKDSSTLANKKTMSAEISLIISNIYDICSWIFNKMTEDEFLDYLHVDYVPLTIIRGLFEEGKLAGDFMATINTIFQSNVGLRGNIGFDIISKFKNGEIKDLKFKMNEAEII